MYKEIIEVFNIFVLIINFYFKKLNILMRDLLIGRLNIFFV